MHLALLGMPADMCFFFEDEHVCIISAIKSLVLSKAESGSLGLDKQSPQPCFWPSQQQFSAFPGLL
jgi:hypothetical protein